MKKVFLATRRKQMSVFGYLPVLFLFLLMSACFASSLHAGQVGQPSPVDNTNIPYSQGTGNVVMTSGDASPTNKEFMSKARVLQMPFIANNGQMDGQVAFYAKTFGGTVFVTKEGEIVYALPEGRDVPAGASPRAHGDAQGSSGAWVQGRKAVFGWHGQAPLVRADAEFVAANTYSPFLRADNATCPPERVLANALLAAYLPGLQKETTQRVVSTPATSNPGVLPANNNPHSEIQNPQSPIKGVALKETIVGAKIGGITGEQPAVTKVNYFTGNDQSKWKTNVPTFDMVSLGEVYKGIELSLKAYGDNVEKLFCVKPGASPECIKVQLDGSKSLRVNQDGQLEADTDLGMVKFTRPIAYQEIEGKRVEVDVEYSLSIPKSAIQNPKSVYGFTVASYDKTHDLIIDPLLASTFLGGNGGECGFSLISDTSGNVYVTGWSSADFPTTRGAYDTSFNGGDSDAFVSKLNSGLTSLLASTFIGGAGYDFGNALTLDTSGNVYVTGLTKSTNFPTTSGAYDTSYNDVDGGPYGDVFISKLNGELTSLLASTFLGGHSDDYGTSLSLDTSGNVYVIGATDSATFPTTSGAYDTSFNGSWDVFVSKLDSGLTSLLASTFLGGSVGGKGNGNDEGLSLTLDTSGNVYVTGGTGSTNFPTTSRAYDATFDGGYTDVFISKLDSGLTSLLASTFLGGYSHDKGFSLSLDTTGNIYVTGYTYSADFPTTSGAYDTSYNDYVDDYSGPSGDVFISKLDGELTSLLASTFLGGDFHDDGVSLVLDTSGNVYVTGSTCSGNFPTTSGAYDTTFNGGYGDVDVFVSKLNSGLTSLLASTFLGGASHDGSYSIALDASGNIYVAGYTTSSAFPMISGAYDTSLGGSQDVFVSKLDGNLSADSICKAKLITAAPKKLSLSKNGNGDVTVTVKGGGGCLVEGATVTATISGSGNKIIDVSPASQKTDANGQAVFAIGAKDKKGTAVIRFRVSGMSKSTTVQVKVR